MSELVTAGSKNEFPSIAALQREHLELLERWTGAAGDERDAKQVREFVARTRNTGLILDQAVDRKAAQAALDYWVIELLLARDKDAPLKSPVLAPFDPTRFPDLKDTPSPYKGLASFAEADARIFFGRSTAVDELMRKVQDRRFVVLSGPSGSGKSSLVEAGLLPRLRPLAFRWKPPCKVLGPATPGGQPIAALLRAVLPPAKLGALQALAEEIRNAPTRLAEIVKDHHEHSVVLVLDQFEEIFTLHQDKSKQDAQTSVAALAHLLHLGHRLLVCIRSDYLGRFKELAPLEDHTADPENFYRPPPLGPSEIRSAIVGPADAVGLRFDEGLVNELVEEVLGEPAALPLLQFTLTRLWNGKERNRITRDVYRTVGRPRDALKRAADEVLRKITQQGEDLAQRIFLKLVTPATESVFLRNPCTREVLWADEADQGEVDRIVEAFVTGGLLRIQKATDDPKNDRIDVAHEALIRNWPWLSDLLRRQWVDHQKLWGLRSTAKLWKDSGGFKGYLLAGEALQEALPFAKKSPELASLIDASKEAEKKKKARLRNAKVGAALVAAAAVGAGWLYYQQALKLGEEQLEITTVEVNSLRRLAEEQRRSAEALRSVEAAYSKRLGELAVSVAREAGEKNDVPTLRGFLLDIGVERSIAARITYSAGGAPRTIDEKGPQVRIEGSTETPREEKSVVSDGGGPYCSGAIWIGYYGDPKIDKFPAVFRGAKGNTFRTDANLWLREDLPGDGYSMATPLGIVPKGGEIIAQDEPRAYDRPSTTQYWLKVLTAAEYCTRVYVQYSGDPSLAQQIVQGIANRGYQVRRAERLRAAEGKAEVRYFSESDRAIAQKLQRQVMELVRGAKIQAVPFTNLPTARERTLELWINL